MYCIPASSKAFACSGDLVFVHMHTAACARLELSSMLLVILLSECSRNELLIFVSQTWHHIIQCITRKQKPRTSLHDAKETCNPIPEIACMGPVYEH